MKTIFETPIDNSYRYKLTDYEKGEMLPLVSDTMFHTMFYNESRKQYVAYFIALALNKNYEEILKTIELSKNELDKDNYHTSNKSVDFVCTIDGEIFNIEMNNNPKKQPLERNIDYMQKLYSANMKTGSKYNYNKVIQININNFNFNGNTKEIEHFYFKNEEGKVLTDKLHIIYIYLPLIRKKLYNKEKLSKLEKLLLVANEKESEKIKEFCKGDKIMEEYRDDATDASIDYQVLGLFDREKDLERVRMLELEDARKEGHEEGLEEGIKEEKIETARRLLDKKIDIELIKEITDLSIDEIKSLQ